MNVLCTQIYLIKGGQVCLPLKKRGFGAGWHNGYGGKLRPNESFEACAKRELWEESGVKALSLKELAILEFDFINTGKKIISHVFVCDKFRGEPKETEEMSPFWFSFGSMPYDKMWPDDRFWMPKLLLGEKFKARFEFLDDRPTLGEFEIKTWE